MVLLLFSAATAADASYSTGPGQVDIALHSDALSSADRLDAEHSRPDCHPGHGTRHASSTMLQMEHRGLKFVPHPLAMTTSVMAARLVTARGTPGAFPAPSPIAVYLLTQRFRT